MIQKNMKKKAEKKDAPAKAARARHAAPQSASVRRAPAYRINRRFPESSSTSRQLQLLLAGSMPLLRQKTGGAAYRVRSFFSSLALRIKARQGSVSGLSYGRPPADHLRRQPGPLHHRHHSLL